MLKFMERATIYYLKQKGWSNVQIAEFTGHHRDTIAKALKEEVDQKPKKRERKSAIAVFDAQIQEWLDQDLPVVRMFEKARADLDHAYTGSETAFYDYVRKVRRARQHPVSDVAIRFEGMPGEYLQIDWGEVREMAIENAGETRTRYFFAARLKYSRFMFVRFEHDMKEETFLRALIEGFQSIGGVPWVVVTDNLKTAVLGRDATNQPVWNPAYQKLAAEFKFLPDACAPASGNQKGAVENLVKFVKGNFLAGRQFHDDADLAEQCQQWLHQVNTERISDATNELPVSRLAEEQSKLGPLPACAQDYGFFDCVVVSRESMVNIESNHYSVPVHLVGQALTARIHRDHICLFADQDLVASHWRASGQHQRIVTPSHFEEAFSRKPRARVMVYRDWLCGLSDGCQLYVREVCQRRRSEMTQQITELYEIAQRESASDFAAALELAAEQQMYGAEYVRVLLLMPKPDASWQPASHVVATRVPITPAQQAIERDLADYEHYVANRESILVGIEQKAEVLG
ncbi:MAG TPA: IS21 family transposase [Ktedonobacteraceae bacterium]|nr:IS21 family transposase [Ktedonobacteraceae bacterium]